MTTSPLHGHFEAAVDLLRPLMEPEEQFVCSLRGERSDFVRFTSSRVRQAGQVSQAVLCLDLMEGARHSEGCCEITGDAARDGRELSALVEMLRAHRREAEDDPHLAFSTQPGTTRDCEGGTLPPPAEIVELVARECRDQDLVGIWASGTTCNGFASSWAQFNWWERTSFNLDWSCHESPARAVKGACAGFDWQPDALAKALRAASTTLADLRHPPKTVPPGTYRAYLAPRALLELMNLLAWEAFGLRNHQTRRSPLARLATGEGRLDPRVTLIERGGGGLAPPFTSRGFDRPAEVRLVEAGRHGATLVDSRSAREYDATVNADSESPDSLEMAPGDLAPGDVLDALDTGVYVSDLWYGNYSDRDTCRMTAMTRYATVWVEKGKVVGPLSPMRMDDSLYELLGARLVDLTAHAELFMDPGSYGGRSRRTTRLPGVLVEGLTFAL